MRLKRCKRASSLPNISILFHHPHIYRYIIHMKLHHIYSHDRVLSRHIGVHFLLTQLAAEDIYLVINIMYIYYIIPGYIHI